MTKVYYRMCSLINFCLVCVPHTLRTLLLIKVIHFDEVVDLLLLLWFQQVWSYTKPVLLSTQSLIFSNSKNNTSTIFMMWKASYNCMTKNRHFKTFRKLPIAFSTRTMKIKSGEKHLQMISCRFIWIRAN